MPMGSKDFSSFEVGTDLLSNRKLYLTRNHPCQEVTRSLFKFYIVEFIKNIQAIIQKATHLFLLYYLDQNVLHLRRAIIIDEEHGTIVQ